MLRSLWLRDLKLLNRDVQKKLIEDSFKIKQEKKIRDLLTKRSMLEPLLKTT